MAHIDFQKVKKITQRNKDIVYGYIKRAGKMFLSEENPYYTIVQLIQDICLLYYRPMIDTKILTDDEQTQLMEMVEKHRQIMSDWVLLFRASRDGITKQDFYKKCNKHNNTICIIHTPHNNVFGGYTSITYNKSKADSYDADDEYDSDPTAFVYKIRSNKAISMKAEIYPVQGNGEYAVQHYETGYLSFGDCGRALYFQTGADRYEVDIKGWASWIDCRQYNITQGELNGDDAGYAPIEIEVFKLQEM